MHLRYLAGFALLAAAPAWADEKPKDPPKSETNYEVPYKLTDTNHVMVRVKLNGKGPFNFILDTGAPAVIISDVIGKKIGADIDKGGWGKYKLEVEGGVTVPEAKALAIDMFQLRGMNAMGVAGVELHGVIGYNMLAKFRITYDFTQDKLVWTPVKFDPPEIIRINKDDGQGGLEMIGNMMKFLAPLLGFKPNFDVRPRGFLGIEGFNFQFIFVVVGVVPDSPANKAGLMKGDLILGVGGKHVHVLNKHAEGERVKLTIVRDGKSMDLDIELGKGL
jgi:serine protease DegQ